MEWRNDGRGEFAVRSSLFGVGKDGRNGMDENDGSYGVETFDWFTCKLRPLTPER